MISEGLITGSFGPEIAEAYNIPTEEWERLTRQEIEQIKSQIMRTMEGLALEDRKVFGSRLRGMLDVAQVSKVTELNNASDLSQEMFMGAYFILMEWK